MRRTKQFKLLSATPSGSVFLQQEQLLCWVEDFGLRGNALPVCEIATPPQILKCWLDFFFMSVLFG